MSQHPTSDRQAPLPRNVRTLGIASLVNDIASEMAFPLLPAFVKTLLGSTPLALGWMEGMADAAASLLKLFSGAWSDRSGSRKGWVVSGYLLAALARPVAGLVQSAWQLAAVRVLDRTGKGVRGAPRDAMVVDSTPEGMRGRAFGFQQAMDHLGAALGPLLASVLLLLWPGALRLLFLLTALPGLAVVLLVVFGLKEEHKPMPAGLPRSRPSFRLTLAPLDRTFVLYLLAVVIFTLGNSSDLFLLWRAGELGVPTWALPLLWSAFNTMQSLASMMSGHWVDRWGSRPLVLAGWIVFALSYAGFAIATNPWQIAGLIAMYAFSCAIVQPAERALVGNLAPSENRGLAFGWFHLATGISNLPSSLLFGALYARWGAAAAFGSGAGLALVAALLLAAIRLRGPAC